MQQSRLDMIVVTTKAAVVKIERSLLTSFAFRIVCRLIVTDLCLSCVLPLLLISTVVSSQRKGQHNMVDSFMTNEARVRIFPPSSATKT